MCACLPGRPCPRCAASDERDYLILAGVPDWTEEERQALYDDQQRQLQDVEAQ